MLLCVEIRLLLRPVVLTAVAKYAREYLTGTLSGTKRLWLKMKAVMAGPCATEVVYY